jgi:endonuclease G, mitochondrial
MDLSTLIVLLLAALSFLGNMVIQDRKKAEKTPKKPTEKPSKKPTEEPEDEPETKPSAGNDLSDRTGYDANFVATKTVKIELKDLLKNHKTQISPLLTPQGTNKNILNYHHFSVAMHKERKMPLLTAVNIDGKQTRVVGKDTGNWKYDPRMSEDYQLGMEIYRQNNLDLGHLVRRLDPVWGREAMIANRDTFHFTVCAPQHANLNRKTWKNLEDYILKNTQAEDLKVSVFTGPIFSEKDMDYRGILLPLQFWKMAAMVKSDGKMSVTAYLLSHKDFLDDMGKNRGLIGDTGFEEYKTFQIPLRRLQELTNLNLDDLLKFDPLNTRKRSLIGGDDFVEIGDSEDMHL